MGKSKEQLWKDDTGEFFYSTAFAQMEEAFRKKDPNYKFWSTFSGNADEDFFAAFFGTNKGEYYSNKMLPQLRLQFDEKGARWTDGLDLTKEEKSISYTYSNFETAEDFIKPVYKFIKAYFDTIKIKVEIKREI